MLEFTLEILNIKHENRDFSMISNQSIVFDKHEIQTSRERINYLNLHIQILKDHLQEYGYLTEKRAFVYINNQIRALERELKIRKDFPY